MLVVVVYDLILYISIFLTIPSITKKAHYNIHNISAYCNGLFSNPDLVQAPFLIKASKVFVLCA